MFGITGGRMRRKVSGEGARKGRKEKSKIGNRKCGREREKG